MHQTALISNKKKWCNDDYWEKDKETLKAAP
jgi:hypothetical protein